MRMYEIAMGFGVGTFDPPVLDETNSKSVGTIIGKFVYGTSYFDKQATFCLIEDDSQEPEELNVIAYMSISNDPIVINGNDYHKISKVHVHQNHQRKGLSTDLYLFLNNKLGIKLMSDDALSNDGLNQMKRFIDSGRFDVSYYNKETKEYTKDQPEELFKQDNKWNVLYESNGSELGNRGLLYGKGHRILSEYDCLDRTKYFD